MPQRGAAVTAALVPLAAACDDGAMTRIMTLTLLMTTLTLAGCDGAVDAGPCADPCATKAPACDGCPAIAETLCEDGACVAVGDATADLVGDVSIARGLDGVIEVTIAVVRGTDCASLPVLTDAVGVLAGSRVDVSGGPFHPDLAFGLVPPGAVLVAADGLDATGTVVGRGCVAVEVSDGANDIGVVTVAP